MSEGGVRVVGRLRLGIIGAGSWAVAAHLPAFARRAEVEPAILCRRDARLAEEIRSTFGFARATSDWHEVIAERPDLVVVAGPAVLHAEQVRAALTAGAHVLCEKPFTVDPRDAWDLTVLAHQRGSTLMCCYGWNEMGIVEHARRLLHEDGGVGEVEHVAVDMATVVRELLATGAAYPGSAASSPPRAETWAEPGIAGGGYSQGQLTHGLGLLFRLLPLRATDVAAFTAHPGGTRVELHDAIAARFDGGAVGTIAGASIPAGTYGNQHQLTIRVTGSRGQLLLDMARPLVRRSRGVADDITVALSDEDVRWSFERVVDGFVDLALGRDVENRSPGELAARVVEVLDAMRRSAASGRFEAIPRG